MPAVLTRLVWMRQVHTGYILLWNFNDPIHPQYVLEAPGDVHCFRFCPTNADVVIGGLESGQVAIWSLAEARAKRREANLLMEDSSEEGKSNTIMCPAQMLSAVFDMDDMDDLIEQVAATHRVVLRAVT